MAASPSGSSSALLLAFRGFGQVFAVRRGVGSKQVASLLFLEFASGGIAAAVIAWIRGQGFGSLHANFATASPSQNEIRLSSFLDPLREAAITEPQTNTSTQSSESLQQLRPCFQMQVCKKGPWSFRKRPTPGAQVQKSEEIARTLLPGILAQSLSGVRLWSPASNVEVERGFTLERAQQDMFLVNVADVIPMFGCFAEVRFSPFCVIA